MSDRSLIFRTLIDHIGANPIKLLCQPQGFVHRHRLRNGHFKLIM